MESSHSCREHSPPLPAAHVHINVHINVETQKLFRKQMFNKKMRACWFLLVFVDVYWYVLFQNLRVNHFCGQQWR